MNLLADILARLIDEFGERLARAPELAQDALIAHFDTGVLVELRFAASGEYSIRWHFEGMSLGIDTAPVHQALATYPHHLHGADGAVHPDPLTDPARAPWDNVRVVVARLLDDPLLARGTPAR